MGATSIAEPMAEVSVARPAGYGWRFIDLALLGDNGWRRYAATLLRILLYPLIAALIVALFVGILIHLGKTAPGWFDPLVASLLQFGLIVVVGAATVYSVERNHHRPWRSLVAPDLRIDRRRLVIGLAVELVILAGQLALIHWVTGWPWRFAAPALPALFALSLLLIVLQAASEELLFRGYLTQALGRRVRSRVLIALVVGLIFGAMHLNRYGSLTVLYFLLLSLIFSLVSLRDERLELAIGGHAAMNLFAFTAANLTVLGPGSGSIGLEPAGVQFNAAAIAILVVHGALFYGLTRLGVHLFCQRLAVP